MTPDTPTPRRRTPAKGTFSLWRLSLAAPPLFLAARAYQMRWTADDGFINFRVVEQILAGNGPVFNKGQRVEVGTSTAWVWLLALVHFLVSGIALEVEAAVLSGALMVAGVTLIMRAAWRYWSHLLPARRAWPIGVGALVLYPALWNFSTSGLEEGLSIFWIGLCCFVLSNVYAGTVARRASGAIALRWYFVLGFGCLVRPDFLLLSGPFLVAVALLERSSWRRWVAQLGVALALPVLYELFRMAYYASLEPNTALAKEAGKSYWAAGIPYVLSGLRSQYIAVPVLAGAVLVAYWLATSGGDRRRFVVPTALYVAGSLEILFVARVGGDFMLDRMMIVPLALVLAPVAMVPMPARRVITGLAGVPLLVAMCVWFPLVAFRFNSVSNNSLGSGSAASAVTGTVIDERAYWMDTSTSAHIVTAQEWLNGGSLAACAGRRARELAQAHQWGVYEISGGTCASVPLLTRLDGRARVGHRVIVSTLSVGVESYEAGPNVIILDGLGLGDPYVARVMLPAVRTGRVGHEKNQPLWSEAPYVRSTSVNPELNEMWKVEQCGALGVLTRDVNGPFRLGDAWRNIRDSFSLTRLRFSPDPATARKALCP